MARPQPADLGTPLPTAATYATASAVRGSRVKDVRAHLRGKMPHVAAGQVWADLDPRSAGRTLEVLHVTRAGEVKTRVLTPRVVAPRTPSKNPIDNTGAIAWISRRRFTENSRGFRLIVQPDPWAPPAATAAAVTSETALARRFADACGLRCTELELRLIRALTGLLGDRVSDYLDAFLAVPDAAEDFYVLGGAEDVLADAYRWADETGLVDRWAGKPVHDTP